MIATIDDVSKGRFGINLVTGWQKAEYDQMGLWPGESHYRDRYAYLAEYATVLGLDGAGHLYATSYNGPVYRFAESDGTLCLQATTLNGSPIHLVVDVAADDARLEEPLPAQCLLAERVARERLELASEPGGRRDRHYRR
mgnify:CR=1 FL=1